MSKKAFDCPSSDLFKFDPEDVSIDKDGPLQDERMNLPVLESLVLDIMVRGVVEPIIVRKNDDGGPVVIDGLQRLKAAVEANKRLRKQGASTLVKIPAVYRQSDDESAYATMIAANEHRQGDSILEKAKKVQRFLALGGCEGDAAVAFGVTLGTIKNWIAVNSCSQSVRSAIRDGKLNVTSAMSLAKLKRDEQNEKLVDLLTEAEKTGRKPKVKNVKNVVRVARGAPTRKASSARTKIQIEFALTLHADKLQKISGYETLRWVLGHIEIKELND